MRSSSADMPKEVFLDHEEMRRDLERLREENAELRRRLRLCVADLGPDYSNQSEQRPSFAEPTPLLTVASSTRDKVALYRHLFGGREDVYAIFWMNERSGKKGYSPAVENPWDFGVGKSKKYLPLTDKVIHDHLTGGNVIGCYPLLKDNTCRFLACDFDNRDGYSIAWLSLMFAKNLECRPILSDRVQEKVATSGFSLPLPYQRYQRGS